MPFDLEMMLTNDEHIKPLLHFYLSEVVPKLAGKSALHEEDWEHVSCPDGNIASFRLDVVAGGCSGSMNIRDGYLRALALCLQKGTMPSMIRVVSIINHHQLHWTCSVAKIHVDPHFLATLKGAFKDKDLTSLPTFRVVNLINRFLHPGKTDSEVENDLTLFGTQTVNIKHYDSHNPDPQHYTGAYYETYRKTLDGLISANPDKAISAKPAKCKTQEGNTCGDNSLWNGFMSGVLALNPKEEFVQVDSKALRAFGEHQTPQLQSFALDEDVQLVKQVRDQLRENISLATAFTNVNVSEVKVTTPTPHSTAKAPEAPKRNSLTKTTRESPQIYFFESSKNKNVNKLLNQFGKGLDTIRANIEKEYTHRKTERGIKGFFQRLNLKIGKVATKRRRQQMDQLAILIDKLQKEKTLNSNEKGIILQGLLKEIIDEIVFNEPKNWYNSRLKGMCQKLNNDLNKMEISSLDTQKAKRLFHIYADDGALSFRYAASKYIDKTPSKLSKPR